MTVRHDVIVAGAYLDRVHGRADGVRFLDQVPIRFGATDAAPAR